MRRQQEQNQLPTQQIAKACRFCADKTLKVDYKDGRTLRPYLTERDKIIPRRMTGLCSFHQRWITKIVKRSRILGFLSFTSAQREAM